MILFNDFISEYRLIKKEINQAISNVLDSGWFILGKELEKFENLFAKYLGVKYLVGVGSGTDAITLSLMALGIGDGDEVITTSLTAFPTITGILRSGAKPVLVDVLLKDGLINPDLIEQKINKKTKCIIPVHLYGQSCEMDKIFTIVKRYNLKIVEDCAQAAGSLYGNNKTGTLGDCGAFSFYPTKNIGAYGDAGAISTNSEVLYKKLRMLRNYGQNSRYYHDLNGLNSRLDEFQAAILSVKLKYLDKWNEKRRQIAKNYNENLISVEPIKENHYGKHIYHLYVIKTLNRVKLQLHLQKNGIQTLIHYPLSINKQKAFPSQINEIFSNSEKLSNEILSLPIHPALKSTEIKKIVKCINEYSS